MMRSAGKTVARNSSVRTPKAARALSNSRRAMPSIPMEEVLSFLKETRGEPAWSASRMAASLRISAAKARQVISILELQGYVRQESESENWMTTLNGQTLSGSSEPRYQLHRVKEALSELEKRIGDLNRNRAVPIRIVQAVAFGDFLSGRPRVQQADVGIRFAPRSRAAGEAKIKSSDGAILRQLRGGRALVKLHPYARWMSARTHRRLV